MTTLPTLSELYASILSDLETQFGVSIPLVGKNFLRVMASVQAAKLKLYYLAIGLVQKNVFPDTADSESIGGTLERFGRVKLGRNPFDARAGEYELIVTGSVGAFIKASTTWKSDDDSLSPGKMFVLDADFTLSATTDTIIVRALEGGTDSKLDANDTLSSTSPIALVDKTATVYAEITEPLAAETLEAYRTAILNSFRLEPQGGAATDYRLWSQDAQGVRFVYPYARSGYPCEVNLFVEANEADSTDGKGTPSAALLDEVEAVVEFNPDDTLPLLERGRRPLQVIVNFLPITPKEVDITVTGYVGLDVDTQTILDAAIEDLIKDIRPFVAAADIVANKNDIIDVNKIIATIIGQKPSAIFTSVTMTIDAVPLLTYTFENGDIPHLNLITYA